MKIALQRIAAVQAPTDVLLVPVAGRAALTSAPVRALDRALGGRLLAEARRAGFSGAPDQDVSYQTHGALPAAAVILAGVGSDPPLARWYEVADAVCRHAGQLRARRAAIALDSAAASVRTVHALAEGTALAAYRFDRYRSAAARASLDTVTLLSDEPSRALRAALGDAAVYARATALARDLANTPAADLTPNDLAVAARGLAGERLRVRVHAGGALARLGMGAILAVGGGSAHPPCLIELAYRPRGTARRRIALVGKGITFDSGGLSLKPADAMQMQKRDMAGGAIVLGVMSALPALELPIEVDAYVPAAENMPSGAAMRPGDVLRAYNGTTIEVLNTDAEGRLVLADALSYAATKRPDVMLDFATLTAVVRSALGPRCAAVLGNDQTLVEAMLAAATAANELLWQLPLISEYRRDLDSRVADLKNIGEPHAGTIVAALFLREFVGGVPWAHVDFSSTVMSDGYACHPRGASGYGVRTALRCLTALAAQAPAKRRAQAAEQK
jgi:leucyl aminopeptidase